MIEDLGKRVIVLSTHLDDAVMSVGATIHQAARAGAKVTVLTVLSDDPESDTGAGFWDGRAGFRTEGESARIRRDEDRRACEVVGATPVWLPFGDMQYGRRGTDEEIWKTVAERVEGADTALVPGFPLTHPDHAWLASLVLDRWLPARRLGLYVEQPYIALHPRWRFALRPWMPGTAAAIAHLFNGSLRWTTVPAGRSERRRKLRAARSYRTQLRLLGAWPPVLWRTAIYESRRGGETIALLSNRNQHS